MKDFQILTDSVEYIENHLCDDFTQQDIADACYCSLSCIQKMFRYAFHCSVKEYVSKRRLTKAAKDLIDDVNISVTEVAMKYQYHSPETFTRAFAKVWGTTPSSYRKNWKFTGIFPKLEIPNKIGGNAMIKKRVDISELYDFLMERKDCYILCFDLKELTVINKNYGTDAGDKAIAECARRIDLKAGENDVLFRIGGDEFALVTEYTSLDTAESLCNSILSLNGTPITHKGMEYPISLSGGVAKYEPEHSHVRYDELFTMLQENIVRIKEKA